MAEIKIFDSRGIKTLVLAGSNCSEQEYDDIEKEEMISAPEDSEAEE